MVRTPCCKAEGLKKGAWTPEEDRKLIAYINKHGEGGWRTLPEKADLKRCGKSCRLRWANYLRPDIKRGEFSAEEEETIIKLHATYGNKWSAIARRLPGRTDNEIKNYWNTHIKKRLIKKGIDPGTHKPISQNSDGPEAISEKSRVEDCCENDDQAKRRQYSSSSSGSARLLNRVANGWSRRVNQSVLTKIIEGGGGGGGGGPRSNSDSVHSDSDCENVVSRTLTSPSTSSTSKLLNKVAMTNAATTNMLIKSFFENNNHASASSASASASSSTFSDSSASINDQVMYCLDTPTTTDDLHGISSEIEHHMDTDDIFKILNNMSNCEGFAEDHMGFVENSGFMQELANILVDEHDMVAPLEVKEVIECTRESYGRAFDEIESYLDDDCLVLQN